MRAETTFDLVGDLIGVDAVIAGPTGSAKATLILDTAAVMTTLVPSVAESIGYTEALRVGWSVTRTAAAEDLRARVAPSRSKARDVAYGKAEQLLDSSLRDVRRLHDQASRGQT